MLLVCHAMAWVKIPAENHPLFHAALPKDPRISTIQMFGGVASLVNGNMFGGLFARSALVKLGEADYADEHTTYHAFCFTCVYDGPITWQPEEVAWGEWVDIARLREMVATLPFVPDTVALVGGLLGEG